MSCDHHCCDYTHMRRPTVSHGQCDCSCHDGDCENRDEHVGECNCHGDYYDWPHHYTGLGACPKGAAMIISRAADALASEGEGR